MSRRRAPTEDELVLWGKVTESVAPLERPPARARPLKPAAPPPKEKTPAKAARPPVLVAAPPAPRPKPPPALHPIDRRTRSRLTRGTVAIDRRVDLHGLTQAAAHARLNRFLREAQAEGARVVLVITGKGKPVGEARGEERGILRRVVPVWLSAADLRTVVIGFDEAGPTHGGAGALYVRLRRAGRP